MLTSTGVPTERFCHACFSGGYPIAIPPETALTKNVLEVPRGTNGDGARRLPVTAVASAVEASLPGLAEEE